VARIDFRTPRLFVDAPLAAGAIVALAREPAHYLTHVLRLREGAPVLVFNGREGEWRARLQDGKRPTLLIEEQIRAQSAPGRLTYAFAPLKHARLDYMVQKAVEMGAAALQPVLTQHTQVSRINLARMGANAVEAAEQCGILSLPAIAEPLTLATWLAGRDQARLLIFCDEDAEIEDPVAALRARQKSALPGCDVLIGPEGGFSKDERALLLDQPDILRLSLGPRILRADTAAVASLALVQAVLGDRAGRAP